MEYSAHNPFLDFSLWPTLNRREDDIVIATYAKFGHLRMQIIIRELVNVSTGQTSNILPWVELRHQKSRERINILNKLRGRRILRTHLSANKVYSHSGKYVFIGRDPRDLVFNLFQFLNEASENWYSSFSQNDEVLSRPSQNFQSFWEDWVNNDGEPFWPYFEHIQSWWKKRNEANVLFIHFLDFKSNMEKELRRISEFLDVDIKPELWPNLFEACDFHRISEACRAEAVMDSPFWNGWEGFSDAAMSTATWEAFLTEKHEIELSNKLADLIGEAGQNWLLTVR